MFKGEYKKISFDGTPFTYQKGDSILFQGKIYKALNYTNLSPIEQNDNWQFQGISEIYASDNPPLEPKVGQIWSTNGKYYSYYYDGNNYSWVQI